MGTEFDQKKDTQEDVSEDEPPPLTERSSDEDQPKSKPRRVESETSEDESDSEVLRGPSIPKETPAQSAPTRVTAVPDVMGMPTRTLRRKTSKAVINHLLFTTGIFTLVDRIMGAGTEVAASLRPQRGVCAEAMTKINHVIKEYQASGRLMQGNYSLDVQEEDDVGFYKRYEKWQKDQEPKVICLEMPDEVQKAVEHMNQCVTDAQRAEHAERVTAFLNHGRRVTRVQ